MGVILAILSQMAPGNLNCMTSFKYFVGNKHLAYVRKFNNNN